MTRRPWKADVSLSPEQTALLIETQFPDLATGATFTRAPLALDLSIAFSFPPPGEARGTFREAYLGRINEAAWDRARFRALWYGGILALYGGEIGDHALRAAGVYALRSAAAPE
jgi:hypothetical protein